MSDSRVAQPTKTVLWFLGLLWALLALNLFAAVARYQVNVLAWDQWDFYAPLFHGGNAWDLFHYQHGPHRQGLAYILTAWVLDATQWDTRWDSLWIASLLATSGLLALRLKWRLTGSLGFTDAWIPLLALSLGQFENILIVPNASHSAGPIVLILLVANAWLSPNRWLRYGVAAVGAACLTFTGFGLFAGAMTTGLLFVAAIRHGIGRDTKGLVAAGAAFATALGGWLLFRSDYVFSPAVDGFKFPWTPLTDYVRFIALMLVEPAGASTDVAAGHYVAGTFLLLVLVGAAAIVTWKWMRTRQPDLSLDVLLLLLGAGLLFVCNTAVGRVSLGTGAGMSSRYVTLMLPLWLGLGLAAAKLGHRRVILGAGVVLWVIALWPYRDLPGRPLAQWPGTAGATDEQSHHYEFYTTNKGAWIDTYLKTGDIAAAQANGTFIYPFPEATHLADKLTFLRDRQLSFFADRRAGGYLPWLLRARTIWNDEYPASDGPHPIEASTRLTFVSTAAGFIDVPVFGDDGDATVPVAIDIQTTHGIEALQLKLPTVLSIPVQPGYNRFTLSRPAGASDSAAIVRAGPVRFSDSATPPAAITIRPTRPENPAVDPSAFRLLACWLLVAVVLTGPAAATLLWLHRRGERNEVILAAVPLAAVGLCGYSAFFAFFAHPLLGQGYTMLLAVAAWIWTCRQYRAASLDFARHALLMPLLVAAGLSLFYLGLLYLPELGVEFSRQSALRFMHELPPDPILPLMLSDKLYAGEPLRPFAIDWLTSDRPPLQAGLHLFALPWIKLLRLPEGLAYQCLGTFAQLIWVPAAWLLARALGQNRGRATITVTLLGFVGFFLLNSVFVWPKLLAAGFVALAAVLLLDPAQPVSRRNILLAAVCAALGWLSHGTVAFSLLAVAPFILGWYRRFDWRKLALGTVVFCLVALPWTLYQKFADPPGNRLLKYHLANVTPIDGRGTLETLRDVYSATPLEVWRANRIANFRLITLGENHEIFEPFSGSPRQRRAHEFFYLFRAIGILNLAWLLWPIVALIRRRTTVSLGLAARLAGWSALTVILWAVLMFAPASTTLHQGSYFAVLVLCLLPAVLLLDLPLWIGGLVLGWQLIYFAATWLPYYGSAALNGSMFFIFALAIVPLASALIAARRASGTSAQR